MWYARLAPMLRVPLVNADRMMLSILPELEQGRLPPWASMLRDTDTSWMAVAQKGVEAFVAQAMARSVPFAMETVFSHWVPQPDGTIASKIDLIRNLQTAGYFVLLLFVGLASAELSIARVATRVATGGHGVDLKKLAARFSRTQLAIRAARGVADATLLADNSRGERQAFTVCRVQFPTTEVFDVRASARTPREITRWLDVVSPR